MVRICLVRRTNLKLTYYMLAVALSMEMYLPFSITIAKLKILLSICSVAKLWGN